MSDTLLRYELDYRANVKDCEREVIEDKIADELASIELTDSTKRLGGAAEINIGPLVLSFNRVVVGDDELCLKGPMGRTVTRIKGGTDLARSMLEFVGSHEDITYRDEREE